MARDDEEEKRRRRREREDELEQEDLERRKKLGTASTHSGEKIEELLARAEPLVDQVDNLYGQFIRGMERRPPLERRQTLDQLMATLSLMGKTSSSLQFRYNNLNAKYVTQRDKWEKWIRDLESGKLKRPGAASGFRPK